MLARSFIIPTLFAGFAGIAGCSSTAAAPEPTATSASAVIKGKNSDTSQDAVVLVIYYDGSTGLVHPRGGGITVAGQRRDLTGLR